MLHVLTPSFPTRRASGLAWLRSALELYDDETCPVCDKPFEPAGFEAHLQAKLAHLDAVTTQRKALEEQVKPITDAIYAAGTAIAKIGRASWRERVCHYV